VGTTVGTKFYKKIRPQSKKKSNILPNSAKDKVQKQTENPNNQWTTPPPKKNKHLLTYKTRTRWGVQQTQNTTSATIGTKQGAWAITTKIGDKTTETENTQKRRTESQILGKMEKVQKKTIKTTEKHKKQTKRKRKKIRKTLDPKKNKKMKSGVATHVK